jgi:hypothetical protein
LNISYADVTIGFVKIVDMQGKIVIEENIEDNTAKINISNLPKGVYILRVQGVAKTFVR